MNKTNRTKTSRRKSQRTTRQEEIHTRLHSAEHFANLLARQGLIQSRNPKEQPWCFYLDNRCGKLVCIFDSQDASRMILELLKGILYPEISEMIYASDAEARDPNEIGLEILMSRQEVWMKYYFESFELLHKHFESVFEDAMMRLIEEVLEVIIPELEGQGGFLLTQQNRAHIRNYGHFSETLNRAWPPPDQRKVLRLRNLKSGRPTKQLRRPKGSGWFKSISEFKVALREILDLSSGKPTELWVINKLTQHPLRQHRERGGTLDGQRKTLRRWLKDADLVDLKTAVEWNARLKQVENELAAQVRIKRTPGKEQVTSLTVSYRAVDPTTGKKEMFTRSSQVSFDPQQNLFKVDGPTAKAALATGAFEVATRETTKRKNIVGK